LKLSKKKKRRKKEQFVEIVLVTNTYTEIEFPDMQRFVIKIIALKVE